MRGVLVVGIACGCSFRSTTSSGIDASGEVDARGRDAPGASVDAAQPRTVTFQQGVAGYTGTQDTFLDESMPDAPRGGDDRFECDQSVTMSFATIGLLRFDGIFGTAATQIPPGASIVKATLTLVIVDGTFSPSPLRESQPAWMQSAATWNNFGGEPGVQGDEIGATIDEVPATLPGEQELDVTESIVAWAAGAPMNGWALMPTSTDGLTVLSSENVTPTVRPRLEVTFR